MTSNTLTASPDCSEGHPFALLVKLLAYFVGAEPIPGFQEQPPRI